MYRLIEKLLIFYLFTFLILLLLPALKSFAGGTSSCGDLFCQQNEENCLDSDCDGKFGCIWCPNAEQCISDEDTCPTPPSVTKSFSQVGGIANSTTSTDWCCGFFANVCAPCGNPAQGFSYQVPNACDDAVQYANLWVRCQDPYCNNLSTGSYEVSVCHYDNQDPSDSSGNETCGDPCTIDPANNRCNADIGVGPVPEGEMIYIKIQPTDSPDAPLKALWSALVEDCSGGIPCPASGLTCCIPHDQDIGCSDCDCQTEVCDTQGYEYCCTEGWDSGCSAQALSECEVCSN